MMVSSVFQIRTANNDDAQAVQSLVFPIMQEFGLDPAPDSADADLVDIDAAYAARGGWLELISRDGVLVGTVGMLPVGEQRIELRKMYLHRDVRGKGLGKALLQRSLRRAVEQGYAEVTLETATVLKKAIALYHRFGFERVLDDYPGCGKNACDQVWRLTLAKYSQPDDHADAIFTESPETQS